MKFCLSSIEVKSVIREHFNLPINVDIHIEIPVEAPKNLEELYEACRAAIAEKKVVKFVKEIRRFNDNNGYNDGLKEAKDFYDAYIVGPSGLGEFCDLFREHFQE